MTKAVGLAWSQVCEIALGLDEAQRDRFWASGQVAEQFLVFFKQNPGTGSSLLKRVTKRA
jgi:hypothetical protein